MINQMQDDASKLNANNYIKGFSDEFKVFNDSFTQIEERVK